MAISTATDPAGVGVRSFHYKRETVSTAPASYTIQAGKTPVLSREMHTNVTTEERWGRYRIAGGPITAPHPPSRLAPIGLI